MTALDCFPADRPWLESRAARLPHQWRRHLAPQYSALYRSEGRQAANLFMLRTARSAEQMPLPLTADDDAIVKRARRLAERCARLPLEVAIDLAESVGVTPPSPKKYSEAGRSRRLGCPRWWRRNLRRLQGRSVEALGRDIGLVRVDRDIYVTDAGLSRRRGQQARNRALLEELQAVNELGQSFTLQELADLSVSCPKMRRMELMTRIAGFEQVALFKGDAGEFWTITVPSRYHASRIVRGGYGRGEPNPKYDGTTPRDGQNYLQLVWARIRAGFHRAGITPYGFRVVEPQHDGTPHWHLLLFMPPEQVERARAIVEHHACAEDRAELRGDTSKRFKAVEIDRSRGSAAGYIAKYIAKSIDGFGVDADLYGTDAKAAAERVAAWASIWGIRQFQQIGGPSVTVWRELRRLRGQAAGTSGPLRAALLAADGGKWADYVEAMGGAVLPRAERPCKPLLKVVEGFGRYGEPKGERIVGVECGIQGVITRAHTWEISRKGDVGSGAFQHGIQQQDGRESGLSGGETSGAARADARPVVGLRRRHADRGADSRFSVLGGDSRPWSPVNNCTEVGRGNAAEVVEENLKWWRERLWSKGGDDERAFEEFRGAGEESAGGSEPVYGG